MKSTCSLLKASRKNPRKFACSKCDRVYTTNQKLKFHILSAHGQGRQFQCPHCPMKLLNPATLSVCYKKRVWLDRNPLNHQRHILSVVKQSQDRTNLKRYRRQIPLRSSLIHTDFVNIERKQYLKWVD